MKIEDVPVRKIKQVQRYREDLGDLETLAQSINELGLLQAIGVNEYYELVFGRRRLYACEHILKWKTIPAHILSFDSILLGEYAENEFRKEFTKSERVAIAKAVEEELGKRAGRPAQEMVGNSPPLGKTRDVAAKRAGFSSSDQYRSAERVVALGSPELVQAMDNQDLSVSAAEAIARTTPQQKQAEILRLPRDQRKAAVKDARAKLEAERRNEVELSFFGIKNQLAKFVKFTVSPQEFWQVAARFADRDMSDLIDRSLNLLVALKEAHPYATRRPQAVRKTN
jgi:ParB family chromosome partitioning protein